MPGLFEPCEEYSLEPCLVFGRYSQECSCATCSHQYDEHACERFQARLMEAAGASVKGNGDGHET